MKKIACALLALFIMLSCTGCGERLINTRDDVEGKRIGVLAGTSSEVYGALHGTVRVCGGKDELISALKQGEIDCIVADSRNAGYIKRFKLGLHTLDEPLAESHFRIAAAKENPDLIEDINRALAALDDNGTLKKIIDGSYDSKDYRYTPPELPEDAKTLVIAVGGDFPPYKGTDESGELYGIDIDVSRAVCAYLGYNAEFTVTDSSKLISQVQSGEVYFAIGGITANSDSADKCIMSEPYAICTQVIIVK